MRDKKPHKKFSNRTFREMGNMKGFGSHKNPKYDYKRINQHQILSVIDEEIDLSERQSFTHKQS